jgi:penicillin-binding protein 1A
MRGVVQHGTGSGVNLPNYDLAGKTGTTSDYRDAWFAGYTGGFVTVVWVGRDDNTPMRGKVTGGGTPAAIWKTYMGSALRRIQVSPIPVGPADSQLGNVAQDALDALLGTQAGQVQSSQAANDNGLPPVVTMKPIPNPEDQDKKDATLDDVFTRAQQGNQ